MTDPNATLLAASLWPDPAARPAPAPGAVPAAYEPEHYAVPEDVPAGEGTRRRSAQADDGRRRNLAYPPAPEPLPHPVADNHTHLDLQDGQVQVSVRDAADAAALAGVGGLVQVGCDVPSSRFAVAAAQADPRVLAAVALHPNEAPKLAAAGTLDEALAEIRALGEHERVRAFGETGLDYYRTEGEGRDHQKRSFREHIRFAKETGKALQIHDRDAHADVVAVLLEEGAPERTVFHCFSGDEELARTCNEHGWYMSFSGTVTFKNSHDLKAALRTARPELVLSETDAPFLTPHPYRGRPNASYVVNYTVRGMAGILEQELAPLCERLWANTVEVYGPF
ncbi:TatD family hydrolase [Kocuria nitroreducens]|uniref:TatD family hydrolase n=1 Tax=Kocuria nitroreducens TaxID=3058914 RepID=UPI0036D94E6B